MSMLTMALIYTGLAFNVAASKLDMHLVPLSRVLVALTLVLLFVVTTTMCCGQFLFKTCSLCVRVLGKLKSSSDEDEDRSAFIASLERERYQPLLVS